MQDLILHVGLPKTGTTALQRDFFPQYKWHPGGGSYVDKPGVLSESFIRLYYQFQNRQGLAARKWEVSARQWWNRARTLSNHTLVLSNENLCQWRLSSTTRGWSLLDVPTGLPEVRVGKAVLPQFVQALENALQGSARVRVILTIRNQNDFLVSLYAQLASNMQHPSQLDFETKTRHMISNRDASIDWNCLVLDLQSTLEPENLLVCVFEDGLQQIAKEMAEFIDPSWAPSIVIGEHNVRRQDGGTWTWTPRTQLRNVGEITARVWPPRLAPQLRESVRPKLYRMGLSKFRTRLDKTATRREAYFDKQLIKAGEDLRLSIRDSCFESNELLGRLLNRDLKLLGY